MAKVAVYHMTHQAFRDGLDSVGRKDAETASAMIIEAAKAGQYVYCARLKIGFTPADAAASKAEGGHGSEKLLDRMWRLTNNVEESWVNNEEVIFTPANPREGRGQRSSMVGDIFWVAEPEVAAFVVSSFGFTKLTDEATKLIVELSKEGVS